jgi:AcrR family transcriptional regulator
MPKRSQEHLDARRRQIVEGAQRCFARHGYAGATVARLEEEIGLSRGAIFNYFPSKQDLFVAVAMDVNARLQRLLLEQGLVAAVREIAAEDPAWLGAMIEAQAKLRHDPDFVRRMEAAVEQAPRVSTWIEDQQRAGTLRGDVSAAHLAQFVGMVLNGLALRVAGEDETAVEPLLRLLHDVVAPRE